MPSAKPTIDGKRECGRCKEWKELSLFNVKQTKLSSYCIKCNKEYHKEYRELNREKIYITNKNYVENNREYVREWNKKYRIEHGAEIKKQRAISWKENAERNHKRQRENRLKKRSYYIQKGSETRRIRKQIDPFYRATENIKRNFTRLIRDSLRGSKSKKIKEYLGIDFDSFKEHIESQFTPEMSWDNYGKCWHIDHTIPCRAFDLTKEEERKKCYHYTNLKPLDAQTNMSKQDVLPNGLRARDVIER